MQVNDPELLISLKDVSCEFRIRTGQIRRKKYEALKNVSYSVNRGETVGIIGKNGSGKSTLLKILSGILRPDGGEIYVKPDIRVSLLVLQAGFSPELSGRDNAILGIMMLGYSYKEAVRRLEKVIEFAELGDWIDEPVKTYSSGMSARLGFSVAIEATPDVLLIDETLGVGDESFRLKSSAYIKQMMRSSQTVVFVSHNLELLKRLCSQILWLELGETRLLGESGQVIDSYLEAIHTKAKVK